MKLSKIYANKSSFKTIVFKPGFNVIYGDVESMPDIIAGKPHEHNIGKTSLVHLIDFMLLKGASKGDTFVKHQDKFSGWIFFLEIRLNSGSYLTIKRCVIPNTKISFKEHYSPNQDFSQETDWTYDDLLLNTKIDDENPIKMLNNYLAFDVLKDFNYRKTLGYLLRDQDSYKNVFELDKFKGPHSAWKPVLFELLGFDPLDLEKKYELESHKKDDERYIARLQEDQESDEVYKIRAAIEVKKRDRDTAKTKVDSFDFFEKEQGINIELVQNIESKISMLNKREYHLNYEVDQIRSSLDTSSGTSLTIEEITSLFEEVKLYFPESLSQDFDAVSRFSKQITTERNKYLVDELKSSQNKLAAIKKELINLSKKRSEALSMLDEKDTFIKYKTYQNQLVLIETEIAKFESKLENAETIESYAISLGNTKAEIKYAADKIKEQIDRSNPDYQAITILFQSFFKTIMGYTALLVVQPNSNGNVDFDCTVLNSSQNFTGQGDGHTSTKALCATFVMAVLAHYSGSSYFKFAFHDGVLESWGNNPRESFLELARIYCKQYDLQYIVSLIKSDVPPGFVFEKDEIRRTLSKEDLLFGFSF
jgi:uncharacterized protein YydD (DUF2326 family)